MQFKHSRWFATRFLFGLKKQFKNYFLYLKLIASQIVLISILDLMLRSLDGVSCQTTHKFVFCDTVTQNYQV